MAQNIIEETIRFLKIFKERYEELTESYFDIIDDSIPTLFDDVYYRYAREDEYGRLYFDIDQTAQEQIEVEHENLKIVASEYIYFKQMINFSILVTYYHSWEKSNQRYFNIDTDEVSFYNIKKTALSRNQSLSEELKIIEKINHISNVFKHGLGRSMDQLKKLDGNWISNSNGYEELNLDNFSDFFIDEIHEKIVSYWEKLKLN